MAPRKPWRVTLTGVDLIGNAHFTGEKKTYEFVRTVLADEESPATKIRVDQWAEGRWCHFETIVPGHTS